MLVCINGVMVVPLEAGLKVAMTVVEPVSEKAQAPVPVHVPPPHPAKTLPAAGLAVRVIVEPRGRFSEQVLPQLMAPPERTTVPVPVPALAMESVACDAWLNVAMTFWAPFMFTVQEVELPEQAPAQPLKVWPGLGVAESVTLVPAA